MGISVTDKGLSISGERKISPEDEKAGYHRREREVGKFSRMINLPGKVDTSKIEAELRDGVLRITLSKAEAVSPRKVTVKVE
jgi:HSP20 family protein